MFKLLTWAVLGIHTGVALGARWSESGSGLPPGTVAAVTTLAVDRQTGSTLYAHTPGGSIFKSTDAGEIWKALSNIAGVRVLALDPTSASTIYAGTGRGILKSTNGGESWSFAGLSDMWVSNLVVDPITPSTVYAGAGAYGYGGAGPQLYKSTDGGESWSALSLSLPASAGISAIVVDPLTPSTLYVLAGSVAFAIYKSTDAGENWSVIDPGPFYYSLLVIDPMSPSTLYAIRFGAGLSKSMDGGATWTATGFTKTSGPLTVDPRNSDILYAATSGPNLTNQVTYKSTDGGKSWNAMNPSFPTGYLILDPANSSIFYAITFGGILSKSTDGGTNWREINTGRRVLNLGVLVGDPVYAATIYAGGDEGLFKSVDSGGSWNKQAAFEVTLPPPGDLPLPVTFQFLPPVAPAGVRSLLIDSTNPNILYVVAKRIDGCIWTDTVLLKSTDGGATWGDTINPRMNSGCLAERLMAMDPTNPSTLYLRWGDYEGYDLGKSTDGGAHWNFTGLGWGLENVLVIDPTRPSTLYAGTDRGVFRSTDGGDKWNPVGLAKANVNLLAIDPLQSNVLYAGTTGVWESLGFRGLFKSTDSGTSWSPINNGLADVLDTHAPLNALIVDPDHPDILYLGFSGYGVFKSTDAGVTWAAFNDGLTHLDVRVLTLIRGASRSVYAGTPGGVFKIVDDGTLSKK